MYKIENLNLSFNNGEKIIILNKGNTLLFYQPKQNAKLISIYEKSIESGYKLTLELELEENITCIYSIMLSNENIIISGWKSVVIFIKKNNSNYLKNQVFYGLSGWGKMIKIKELKNECFGVCGYNGLTTFQKQFANYEISFEIKAEEEIYDFMEIKWKDNSFIMCGKKKIYIINDKKIVNKINFELTNKSGFYMTLMNFFDYICQFRDDLYVICGSKYIILINTRENKFKQIEFLKENDESKFHIYKYNSNSIIILSGEKIIIIQIIDDERIQIKTRIIFKDKFFLRFVKEERAIYFIENNNIGKLKFKRNFM